MMTGKRQPYISQQLAALREANLVSTERQGWNVLYKTNPMKLAELKAAVSQILQSEQSQVEANTISLKKNSNTWHGIPRAEIQWQPTLIADLCNGCGLCATSCGRGVYAFDYDQYRPVLIAPEMCMVGCSTCATICEQNAIEFPSTGYIRQVIRQNMVMHQVKNMLQEDREKFDLRVQQGNNH